MYVILMYDICQEGRGQYIQRNVFKTCKKYLYHVQLSVFEGEITKANYQKLLIELKKYIRNIDSVIIFKSRSEKWLDKEILGNTKDLTDNFL
ncbi:MAG: CRISPR-associated endonuclease Cas2 [Agathobacter sp.]|nr:CRISPR-associated endonuclease Cas2 [Agathobacter sp.]